jgi:hypothetical protein
MSDWPGVPEPAADVDPLTVFAPARRQPDLRSMTRIVLRPMARHATHGSLAMQLRDIERQAGVRRTL